MINTELMPVLKLRELCLATVNPQFYAKHSDLIHRASLAAQDYIVSGASREYQSYMGNKFHELDGYVAVHQKYDLTEKVNPNLVMDLVWSFKSDCINGIIDAHGNIKNVARLCQSRIMGVYHNSELSGIPNSVFKLYPERFDKLIAQAQSKIK